MTAPNIFAIANRERDEELSKHRSIPRTGIADRDTVIGNRPPVRYGRSGLPIPSPEDAAGALRSVAQGATFGFGDELEAAIRSPFNDRGYREIRADIREQNAGFRERHPMGDMGLQLAGGFVTGGAAERGLASLVGEGTRLARPAAAAAKLVGGPIRQGAVAGAIGGVGYSDEDGIDFGDAVRGAALGGAVGGGLRAVTSGPAAIRRGFQALVGSDEAIQRGARDVVRSQVERAGGQDAVQRGLDALLEHADGDARVFDAMGTGARRVVRGAATRGGTVGDDIADQLTARRDGATDRVHQLVHRGLGGDALDVDDAARQIHQLAGELADRSYGEVFERGTLVEGPELVRLLDNPTVRKAWNRVAEIDANFQAAGGEGRYRLDLWRDLPGSTGTGSNVPARTSNLDDRATALYDAFRDSGAMDLQSADALKRGLDDVLRSGFDGNTIGGLKGEQRASVVALKNKLLALADHADDLARDAEVGLTGRGTDVVRQGEAGTPGKSYREARKEFETAMGWRSALLDGERLLSASPEEVRTAWAKLSPEERDLALVGFRSKVLERLGKSDVGRDRTRGLLSSPDLRQRLRVMLGDRAEGFLASLRTERGLADADRFVLGGSNTAGKLADASGDALRLQDVADAALAARSPGAAGRYLFRRGAGTLDRLRTGAYGRVGDEAARQLTRPADEFGDVLDWMNKQARHWTGDLAEAGRRVPVAGVGGMAVGRP